VLDPGFDMFNNPDVITTGVLSFGMNELAAGNHRITFEIVGANPEGVKAYMLAVDYIRLVPTQKNSGEKNPAEKK
jgi:hypothetical protein